VLLVEEAVKEGGGSAQWGEEGYYFCEAGEFVSFSQSFAFAANMKDLLEVG
jgi:hypothetical protein